MQPALDGQVLAECFGEGQEQYDHLNPFLFGVVVGSSLFLLAVILFGLRMNCAPRTAVWDDVDQYMNYRDEMIKLSIDGPFRRVEYLRRMIRHSASTDSDGNNWGA